MTVGEKIKEIRLQKGMTQKELGDECGLADSAIRRYELGGANPKFETLIKIARALGVSVATLRPLDISPAELGRIQGQRGSRLRYYSSEYDGPPIDFFEEVRLSKIEDYMLHLNEEGQEKAVAQVKMLTMIPEYQRENEPPSEN